MNDLAAGQGQIGLDCIQFPVRYFQRAGIATEDKTLVEEPGPFDSFIHAHRPTVC
jgi:hypothetical protein